MAKDLFEAEGIQPRDLFQEEGVKAPEVNQRDENIRKMTGFKGLAAETLLNLSNAMKSGVLFGRDLPDMLKESVKAEEERPFRPWLATGGALAEIGKGTVNASHDLMKFVARKKILPEGVNEAYEAIADSPFYPHIPEDTGIATLFGLDKPQPEDRLYKGLANAMATIAPGQLSKLKGVEGGKAPKKTLPKDILKTIDKEKNLLTLGEKQLSRFKDSLESNTEYRSGNWKKLTRDAGDMKKKIKQLEPLTKIEEKAVPQLPKAPNTGKMTRMASEDVNQAKESLSRRLGEGRAHHIEAGEVFGEEIGSVRKAADTQFKDTRKYFADKDIQIDKSSEINKVKDEIKSLQSHYKDIPGYEEGTPDVKALESHLAKLEHPESIKAADILDTYESLQKMAKNLNDKMYERGNSLTKDQFSQMKSDAKSYLRLADELGDILSQVGDKNGIKMLKDARSAWREYASLYGNPIFQHLERHQAIPTGTLGKLELGTSGNELLNKIIEKRPELREMIFGQKYANPKSHGELLRPSDLNDKHLKQMPEVKDLVEAFKNAAENLNEVKSTAADLNQQHKEFKDSVKELAAEQKIRKDAIADVEKYQKQSKNNLRATEIIKKKMDQAKARGENIETLEQQYNDMIAKNARIKNLLKKALKIVANYGGLKSAISH